MFFQSPTRIRKDAARRQLLLMSFEGMRKSIRTIEAPVQNTDASAHLSDEFPAGYSLTGCSPALPASASPAGVEYASGPTQLRGSLFMKPFQQPNHDNSGPTLIDPFFCPNNGVHLTPKAEWEL
jgi:hypothetical protein